METLRVYRPRLVVYGQAGMGQAYLGAAALHHLEGYHIQNLDLGTLMGDSTRVTKNICPHHGDLIWICTLDCRGSDRTVVR